MRLAYGDESKLKWEVCNAGHNLGVISYFGNRQQLPANVLTLAFTSTSFSLPKGNSLKGQMLKLKLQYSGHLMWRTDLPGRCFHGWSCDHAPGWKLGSQLVTRDLPSHRCLLTSQGVSSSRSSQANQAWGANASLAAAPGQGRGFKDQVFHSQQPRVQKRTPCCSSPFQWLEGLISLFTLMAFSRDSEVHGDAEAGGKLEKGWRFPAFT